MRPGAPIAHATPGRTYLRVLGTFGITLRHSMQGIASSGGNVVSWTDQVSALTEPAPGVSQRPPYAADGSNFGGKTAVNAANSGPKFLRATGLSGLPAVGTRPYIFGAFRCRTVPGAGAFPAFSAIGTSAGGEVTPQQNGQTGKTTANYSGVVVAGPNNDAAMHWLDIYADGTNVYLVVDGTVYSTPSNVSLANTCDRSSTGQGTSSAADSLLHGDITCVLKGTALGGLSSGDRASLRALARAEFSF